MIRSWCRHRIRETDLQACGLIAPHGAILASLAQKWILAVRLPAVTFGETTGAITLLPPEVKSGRPCCHVRAAGRRAALSVRTADLRPVRSADRRRSPGHGGLPEAPEATTRRQGDWFFAETPATSTTRVSLHYDRVKDMIVSGGGHLPRRVRGAVGAAVADVAVIGVPDERWERPKAVVVKKAGAAVTQRRLITWARENRRLSCRSPSTSRGAAAHPTGDPEASVQGLLGNQGAAGQLNA